METSVFDGLDDELSLTPHEALGELLGSAKRGFVPMRNSFVQHPRGSSNRGSMVAELVTHRYERPFDAVATLHALMPVLENDPLPLGSWANILSTRTPCGVTTASKTFKVLEDMGLLTRSRAGGRTVLTPLCEDGSRRPWFKAGSRGSEQYFVVPHEYWTDGYIDTLRLPGKAMLFIMLKETQVDPVFTMAIERAPEWYGISERTAERGYNELERANLLNVHIQKVASARLPPGVMRKIHHRALRGPFSTKNREALQAASRTRTRAESED